MQQRIEKLNEKTKRTRCSYFVSPSLAYYNLIKYNIYISKTDKNNKTKTIKREKEIN
jgi:hypothetical protein